MAHTFDRGGCVSIQVSRLALDWGLGEITSSLHRFQTCIKSTLDLGTPWYDCISCLESASAGLEKLGTPSIQHITSLSSSKEHIPRMIKSRLSFCDLHFTKQAWTLWLSGKTTSLSLEKKSRNVLRAVKMARPSNSRMAIFWSWLVMAAKTSGRTGSPKQPRQAPLRSKRRPPTPE